MRNTRRAGLVVGVHGIVVRSLVGILVGIVAGSAGGQVEAARHGGGGADPVGEWTPPTLATCAAAGPMGGLEPPGGGGPARMVAAGAPPAASVAEGPRGGPHRGPHGGAAPRATRGAAPGAARGAAPGAARGPKKTKPAKGPQVTFDRVTQTVVEMRRGRMARSNSARRGSGHPQDGHVGRPRHDGLAGRAPDDPDRGRVDRNRGHERRRRVAFDPRTATEADYLEVRVLLARARPVRLFRRLARRHGTRVRAAGLSPNCFLNYEREVVVAWSDLEGVLWLGVGALLPDV